MIKKLTTVAVMIFIISGLITACKTERAVTMIKLVHELDANKTMVFMAEKTAQKQKWLRAAVDESVKKFMGAIPGLLLIIIVVGGIIAGIFTATEASAVAVLYSLILAAGFYREVRVPGLPGILLKTVETAAIVMLLPVYMAMIATLLLVTYVL